MIVKINSLNQVWVNIKREVMVNVLIVLVSIFLYNALSNLITTTLKNC